MISKSQIKLINRLRIKKFRTNDGMFIIEGVKMVSELIKSDFEITTIFALADWINSNKIPKLSNKIIEITPKELKAISNLKEPHEVIAIAKTKKIPAFRKTDFCENNLILAFENIQDPGNLGTIIRTADWFGIKDIICSENSVDLYNPKVVQSTMGSIFRVRVHYIDLKELNSLSNDFRIIGTFLEGNNVYNYSVPEKTILVFGNESGGISEDIQHLMHDKIHIPCLQKSNSKPESLNLAISTAVCCSQWIYKLNYSK